MITSQDLERINHLLLRTSSFGKVTCLEEKLLRLNIITSGDTPKDLVTMNSEVVLNDLTLSEICKIKLVYQILPFLGNQTSILSPLGTALLGMRVRDVVSYNLRNGEVREIRIDEIIFQPEASGRFDL